MERMSEPLSLSIQQFQPERLALFWGFICERQMIWHRRFVQKLPAPWTTDPIMRAERFTNIYRELDPGTQYVINNILEQDAPKPDKIFNTMLYRLIGRSDTHATLGFQRLEIFTPEHFERQMKHIRDVEGKPPFTAAYMVSGYTSMGSPDKIENIARLFGRLHQGFDEFYARIEACASSEAVYDVLRTANGFGNFLAYQVLVDLLYPLKVYGNVPLLPFAHDDWASAGPGAVRGIKLLLKPGVQASHLAVMRWLRDNHEGEFVRLGLQFPFLIDHGQPRRISLANIQNCLCEFHKYVKIGAGTGRGRRKFATPAMASGVEQPPLGLESRDMELAVEEKA